MSKPQDFSRLETKSVVLEHLPFDLTELVDGALDQLSEVAANKNIGQYISKTFHASD